MTTPIRFAYADPPYIGQSKRLYGDHPDYAGEVDHAELIDRLMAEFPRRLGAIAIHEVPPADHAAVPPRRPHSCLGEADRPADG
jgi:hypothetical protein